MQELDVSGEQFLRKPAIGVVATDDNADEIGRIVALAREHGHEVIVAYDRDDLDSLELVRELNVATISLDEGWSDWDDAYKVLSVAAKAMGFPGLIYHPNTAVYIDYDRSTERHEDGSEFACKASTRQLSSREDGSALVAIPAYNEEATISSVVRAVREQTENVVVIDDGSDDATADVASTAGATVVRHQSNRGYGAALQSAFNEAKRLGSDHLVVVDGDGQHDPSDIPKLLAEFDESDANIVIGSRFRSDAGTDFPLYRWFGLKVINVLTNVSLGFVRPSSRISDTQCGFRAYDKTAIRSIADDNSIGDNMGASTDILYHACERGFTIREVGTTVSYNVENASTINPITHGLALINNLLKTVERKRPVTVLGIPGFAISLLGFVFGYWTLTYFSATQEVSTGLVTVTGLLILSGMFTCFTAIILHSLATHFETIDATE